MSAFEDLFDTERQVVARAHGRVNLIGEHTDYNDGFMLPTPIPQEAVVEMAARSDHVVRVASLDFGGAPVVATFRLGEATRSREWVDYIKGITAVLADERLPITGFDATIHSSVPMGGGLSSSAALGVALLRALRHRFTLALDDRALALLVQRSENEFVGAHVGIMDPLVASVGEIGAALFIDARDLSTRSIAIPPSIEIVVVDSGTRHSLAGSEYNTRRAECARACELLGVRSLRELSIDDVGRIDALPDPWGKRARHVVTENARVLAAVEALESADRVTLGCLLEASHLSLRDDYQVSTEAVDLLVRALEGQHGVFGARITGGGFGGSVVAVAEVGLGLAAALRAAYSYRSVTGHEAAVRVPLREVASVEGSVA